MTATTDPGNGGSPFETETLFDRAEEIREENGGSLEDALEQAFTEAQEKAG